MPPMPDDLEFEAVPAGNRSSLLRVAGPDTPVRLDASLVVHRPGEPLQIAALPGSQVTDENGWRAAFALGDDVFEPTQRFTLLVGDGSAGPPGMPRVRARPAPVAAPEIDVEREKLRRERDAMLASLLEERTVREQVAAELETEQAMRIALEAELAERAEALSQRDVQIAELSASLDEVREGAEAAAAQADAVRARVDDAEERAAAAQEAAHRTAQELAAAHAERDRDADEFAQRRAELE